MQLQQPLALLHVALAARQIPGVPRVDQVHLQAGFLQHVIQRDPIHSRRLHRHRHNAVFLQKHRQFPKVRGEASEPPHRLRAFVRRNRDIVLAIAYIDPGRVAMHHVQPGIVRPYLALLLPSLLPIRFGFRRHVLFSRHIGRSSPLFWNTQCGPAANRKLLSPTGSSPIFFKTGCHQTNERQTPEPYCQSGMKAPQDRRP